MAYVLTNGEYYIKMTETGKTAKTQDVSEARIYITADKAKERLLKAPGKTKGYYIKDTDTNTKYEFNRNKGRVKFPKEVRKLIYNTAKDFLVSDGKEKSQKFAVDFSEKVCKKIDFWIGKAVKKLKKVKKYVILYIVDYIYID